MKYGLDGKALLHAQGGISLDLALRQVCAFLMARSQTLSLMYKQQLSITSIIVQVSAIF